MFVTFATRAFLKKATWKSIVEFTLVSVHLSANNVGLVSCVVRKWLFTIASCTRVNGLTNVPIAPRISNEEIWCENTKGFIRIPVLTLVNSATKLSPKGTRWSSIHDCIQEKGLMYARSAAKDSVKVETSRNTCESTEKSHRKSCIKTTKENQRQTSTT